MINRVKWAVKQILPLTYRSHYKMDGEKYFSVWRMWFGRVFDHESFKIGEVDE